MATSKRSQHAADSIPPRGPALQRAADRMMFTFDVDCGELIEGHRFIARGICDQGTDRRHDDAKDVPLFSLEYELVPGIAEEEEERRPFSWLVGIEYAADVPLPWEPNDSGVIAPFEGGVSTHGSRGDWPLPRSARVLRFTLTGVDSETGWGQVEPRGVLIVDLQAETAVWAPPT